MKGQILHNFRLNGLGLLISGLLFLSGCNLFPPAVSENYDAELKLMPRTAETASTTLPGFPEFQYTAPWDTTQYDDFYQSAEIVFGIGEVKGGIVPHHLLAGYIPATFFNYLSKQKPSLVVIIGPNHFGRGGANAISTMRDWQTPHGITETDKKIVGALASKGLIRIQEGAIKEEHSLYSIIPFIKKSLPDAKVVPIMLAYKTDKLKLDSIIAELLAILPKDAVVVGSIDFSHYQTLASANFHDELSRAVIKNFEYDRLNKLEIDSVPSLYVVLKMMENFGTQKIGYEISDNSARILNDFSLKETTSYYSPYFVAKCHSREGGNPVTESTYPTVDSRLRGNDSRVCESLDRAASILNFGDLMLDRNVKKVIDSASSTDYLFEKLAGQENRFFMGVDDIGANLEGPFANSRRSTSKSIAFRFEPALMKLLKKYNFSIFNLANNHTLDMGAGGFEESKNNLTKYGFDFYGSQNNIDDNSLLIKKVGNLDIAFIGVNDTTAPADINKIKILIKKSSTADFVIVNIHWGEEYKEISNAHQRKLARDLIDAGADAIIGHHPHVVQEMEIYKNRPIFYSLGNFIFDQYFSAPTQQGLAVGLVFNCHCEEARSADEAIPCLACHSSEGGNPVSQCCQKSISTYIFPLQSANSQPAQMDYFKALKYFDKWISKSRIGNNKFKNFNLVTQL